MRYTELLAIFRLIQIDLVTFIQLEKRLKLIQALWLSGVSFSSHKFECVYCATIFKPFEPLQTLAQCEPPERVMWFLQLSSSILCQFNQTEDVAK